MTASELIKDWFKEMKLSSHYTINQYDMIECQKNHTSGVNRIRIIEDSVYCWQISNGNFNKIIVNIADPDFFEKLLTLLEKQCIDRRKKVYRQL